MSLNVSSDVLSLSGPQPLPKMKQGEMDMNFLYNSAGNPVACEVNGLLFAPSGRNIGRLVKKAGVYADQNGRYLGEVICVNRLVYNRCSKYLNANLGTAKGQGYIGAAVSLKKFSPILLPAGYEDLQQTG